MNFPLSSIAKGPADLNLEAEVSDLPELFEAGGYGKIQVRLNAVPLADGGILIQGHAGGMLRVECGRCVEKLEQAFSVPFNILAGKREETGLEWLDDEDQGIEDYQVRLGPDAVEIPLGPLIVEQVLLNYNLHPLPALDASNRCVQCGKSFMAGVPGKPDRVDPRWAGLKSLKGEPRKTGDGRPEGPTGK